MPSAADRSLKGNIVAEADRFIDPDKIIIRTAQYGLEHYPELDRDGHYKRTVAHMHVTRASASRPRLDRDNYSYAVSKRDLLPVRTSVSTEA